MSSPSTPSSATPDAAKRHTLLALSNIELDLFFGERDRAKVRFPNTACTEEMDPKEWRRQLEETKPTVVVTGWTTPAIPPECTRIHGGSINYVCHVSGSIRHVVDRDLIAEGLWVTNWGTLVAPLVAEHALLLTLSCLRNQQEWPQFITAPNNKYKSALETRTLFGRRIGLYGFGSIAQALLPLIKQFNPEVSSYSAAMPQHLIQAAGVTPVDSLTELCRHSEVLIVCEALTAETRGELDANALNALPEGAVLVNVGRGATIDEPALLQAIKRRKLRVGLDVLCQEPMPQDSPWLEIPNALLSPHIGGPTNDSYVQFGERAIANIEAYYRDEIPTGLITTEVYDRST